MFGLNEIIARNEHQAKKELAERKRTIDAEKKKQKLEQMRKRSN